MNLNIVLFELKLNFKKYVIWNVVWILLFILLFSFFDIVKDNAELLGDFAEQYEAVESFYSDEEAFSTIKGYFNGEAFTSYLLVSAIFIGFIGNGLVGGEINTKKLTYTLSRQVSRWNIMNSKLIAQILLLLGSAVIQTFTTLLIVELFTSGTDQTFTFFFTSFIGAFVIQLFFLIFGVTIGLFTIAGGALAAGLGFSTWIINLFSELEGPLSNLKYLSPFYYLNIDFIKDNSELELEKLLVIMIATLGLYLLGVFKFYRKDVRG